MIQMEYKMRIGKSTPKHRSQIFVWIWNISKVDSVDSQARFWWAELEKKFQSPRWSQEMNHCVVTSKTVCRALSDIKEIPFNQPRFSANRFLFRSENIMKSFNRTEEIWTQSDHDTRHSCGDLFSSYAINNYKPLCCILAIGINI